MPARRLSSCRHSREAYADYLFDVVIDNSERARSHTQVT
jgi:hypothetical protein